MSKFKLRLPIVGFVTLALCVLALFLPVPSIGQEAADSASPLCNNQQGIDTAFGCIALAPEEFIGTLLQILIGISGGIAFLLMLFGSFLVIISSGNPDKAKAGHELITAAISGLLFIIFSLLILELIGVKILNIPGFGQ